MAVTEAQRRAVEAARKARAEKQQQLIDAGEIVPNRPYRERVQWLMRNDPDFALSELCEALDAEGIEGFIRGSNHKRADTSHIQRILGLRRQAASFHGGHRYGGDTTRQWIPYDLANALYRALDMHPSCEDGLPDRPPDGRHQPKSCGWGAGCERAPGYGQSRAFCEEHAQELSQIRWRWSNQKTRRKRKWKVWKDDFFGVDEWADEERALAEAGFRRTHEYNMTIGQHDAPAPNPS